MVQKPRSGLRSLGFSRRKSGEGGFRSLALELHGAALSDTAVGSEGRETGSGSGHCRALRRCDGEGRGSGGTFDKWMCIRGSFVWAFVGAIVSSLCSLC